MVAKPVNISMMLGVKYRKICLWLRGLVYGLCVRLSVCVCVCIYLYLSVCPSIRLRLSNYLYLAISIEIDYQVSLSHCDVLCPNRITI